MECGHLRPCHVQRLEKPDCTETAAAECELMTATPNTPEGGAGPWDEEHVKALLSFPRYSVRLVQEEPWQSWVSQRGGLKGIYEFLRGYSFSPGLRRILDVVLSNPDEIADVYASHLNISRATYFYRLRELVPAVVHALNQWQLPEPVPPTASARAASTPRLPTPLTALIGTEGMLNSLAALVGRKDVRMLTLLGPGGVGKTRLGIELARRASPAFADRAWFVDLATLPASGALLPALARALGLATADQGAIEALLAQHPALLLLDNFEHLLPQASLVSDLLVAAPDLKVIVTSRAALHVYGEYQFIVPPLPAPGSSGQADLVALAAFPAVALFVERARSVNPDFELTPANAAAVAELCVRLDGVPLSIELAAFQARFYSPQAMLVRLSTSRRLAFLEGAPKAMHVHQRTPREMLDWSYRLLPQDLQLLLNRLAVFADGCTADASDDICQAPTAAGLAALAEQSLVQQRIQPDGEPRYTLLGITREYAAEQLAFLGETADRERRFAEYYLHLAETPVQPRQAWAEMVAREHDNLVAALEWFLAGGSGESALRLVAALWGYWRGSGGQPEAFRLMQDVLERTHAVAHPIRLRILQLTGWLARQRSDLATAAWAFQSMFTLAAALDDPQAAARAELGLAGVAGWQSRWPEAQERIARALALLQAEAGPHDLARALLATARIAFSQGDLDTALARCEESLAQLDAGLHPSARAAALCLLGQVHYHAGRLDQAALSLEEALHLNQTAGDSFSLDVARAQVYLALIEIRQNRLDPAAAALEAVFALSRAQGYQAALDLAHGAAARLAAAQGNPTGERHALMESLKLQEAIREAGRALDLLEEVSGCLLGVREPLAAARLLGAASTQRETLAIPRTGLRAEEFERCLEALREQLDSVTLDDAWLAGQGLSLDQALIYARRCLE